MKKILGILIVSTMFIILSALSVSAAEIVEVECNKNGVMLYESGNETVEQTFNFRIRATGDTHKILMKGAYDRGVVAVSEFGNLGKDEQIMLYTQDFLSSIEGKREFRFWAVGFDGSETEFAEPIIIDCYKEGNEKRTVYSVDLKSDIIHERDGSVIDEVEKIQLTICTSINTRELRMTTESGTIVDAISIHCKERGTCDIKDGKKYWYVYFASEILGDRSFSFQAMHNGNPIGDIKTVKFKVLSWEEWEMMAAGKGSQGTGTQPGTDEGFSSGDDTGATGNEDGVEYGGDGKSDTGSPDGIKAEGDSKGDSDVGMEGNTSQEKPDIKPDDSVNNKPNNNTGIGALINNPNATNGNGSCCREEDFISLAVPRSRKAVVIEFPNGEKFNAEDQVKKNLALKKPDRSGEDYTWVIWLGDKYRFNDVNIKILDDNYEHVYNSYIAFKTHPFTDEEREILEKGIKEEIRIRTNPKKKVITLTIGDEMMTIDGKKYEVDPGRGTKPLIVDGRTLLPVRAVVEALGGNISWNDKEKRVDINVFNKDIRFKIGSYDITWNSIPEKIDVPAQIINDRTMLPIRFVAQCLDYTVVEWDDSTKTVTITYNY